MTDPLMKATETAASLLHQSWQLQALTEQLQAQNETLKTRVAELEARVAELESEK